MRSLPMRLSCRDGTHGAGTIEQIAAVKSRSRPLRARIEWLENEEEWFSRDPLDQQPYRSYRVSLFGDVDTLQVDCRVYVCGTVLCKNWKRCTRTASNELDDLKQEPPGSRGSSRPKHLFKFFSITNQPFMDIIFWNKISKSPIHTWNSQALFYSVIKNSMDSAR